MGIEEELEKQIIKNAKKQAEKIIMDAQMSADATYASSLQYVDDMLSELNLVTLRAKDSMKKMMEELLEQFDKEIDMIHQNKLEILEDLRDMSENNRQRLSRPQYEIKINEAYFQRRPYEIQVPANGREALETRKAAKQSFEIKVAEEWRERIEQLSREREIEEEEDVKAFQESAPIRLPELIADDKESEPAAEGSAEEELGYKANDFDLDAEYFNWLKESEPPKEQKSRVGIWKVRKRKKR